MKISPLKSATWYSRPACTFDRHRTHLSHLFQGGGIAHSDVSKLFTYFYTTAAPPTKETLESLNGGAAPMAGLGYGLPISRLYARYFGGDLKVIPMVRHSLPQLPILLLI